MSSNPYNYMDYRGETIERQTRTAFGNLVAGQLVGAGQFSHSVCDTKAPLQLQYAACGGI